MKPGIIIAIVIGIILIVFIGGKLTAGTAEVKDTTMEQLAAITRDTKSCGKDCRKLCRHFKIIGGHRRSCKKNCKSDCVKGIDITKKEY